MRLTAFAAAAVTLALATPCLALTVQTTPTREQAEHLRQQQQNAPASLPQGFYMSDRPGVTGSGFSNAQTMTPGVTTYGFGNVRTTVITDPEAPLLDTRRRETPAPLSLSPPRR